MIFWSLFDSGNGSYSRTLSKHDDVTNFAIGIDREKKNDHFINLDLADYKRLFGDNTLFDTLDKLPKPDVILASPPCESWSVASAMDRGNACWKQETGDSLFAPQQPLSRFTVRDFKDYEKHNYIPHKAILTRINGELTVFNTIKIIERYALKVFVIENPAYGRIWEYIDKILGFDIQHENLTYYNNYDYPIKKPTKFKSNIDLKLKSEGNIRNEVDFNKTGWGYNERSNIPEQLVDYMINTIIKHLEEE